MDYQPLAEGGWASVGYGNDNPELSFSAFDFNPLSFTLTFSVPMFCFAEDESLTAGTRLLNNPKDYPLDNSQMSTF